MSLVAWFLIVVAVAMFGTFAAALTAADRNHTEPPSRLDLMDAGRCGAISPEGWICDRDARHDDDIHADSTKGGDLGRARWAA